MSDARLSDEEWTVTDERIVELEALVAANPCGQSAFCPDGESATRFALHIVAAKLLAEVRHLRARQLSAEDREALEFAREATLGHLARVGNEAACMSTLDVLERLLQGDK